MENLYNGLRRTAQTLETDATLMLQKRPRDGNPNPNAFENFGSSLRVAPSSSQEQPKSKFKPHIAVSREPTRSISIKKPRPIGIKKPLADFFKDDSEDELDLLSSSQPDPDDYQPSNKASVSQPDKYEDGNGKVHDYDPKFPFKRSQVLSKLKFNKIKLDGKDNATIPSSSSSSSLKNQPDSNENSQDFGSWANDLTKKGANKQTTGENSDDDDFLEISSPLPLKSSNQRLGPPQSTPKQPTNHKLPDVFLPARSNPFPMDTISPLGGKAQKKVLPKPSIKIKSPSFKKSRKPRAFPMPSPQSSDTAGKRASLQTKGKNKAQPFPEEVTISPLGGKVQKKVLPKPSIKIKSPSFKKSRKPRAFPMPSPQSSDTAGIRASLQSKGKNKAQPFPEEGLSKHQMRMSEGRSDDERQAKKKKRISLSPSRYSSEDEGDSITISPDTDPRTLCPYCDTLLPSSPSPLLINILAATRKKSTRDPRPSNPLGLKAPLAIFIVACQRHRFESQILPEAERKGWPKTIQWKKLGARVEGMKDELQALIEDPGGEHEDVDEDIDEVERLFRDDSDGTGQKGPKSRSIFWTEVMDEVKKKGSRAVVGVRGQFANFEKTQPGYYGEQGSVIIHQTLFDMFPPASFDPTRILPLTSNEFVLRILVPEVALRLIMEDMDLEMHQALIVLRESSAYGVAMFPEDGGEGSTGKKRRDDEMCVGDKIVMERARKRRKELEEEEEQEEREEARRIAEMEASVEMQQAKVKTPVRKHSRPPDHRAKDTSDEQTPKPLIRPLIGGSNDIKPLMIARMRQSQKSDSESKFGEADVPCRLRNDKRAPNLRAIEDTTDTEVESPDNYGWLLNDTSQSSMEGKSTSRRKRY